MPYQLTAAIRTAWPFPSRIWTPWVCQYPAPAGGSSVPAARAAATAAKSMPAERMATRRRFKTGILYPKKPLDPARSRSRFVAPEDVHGLLVLLLQAVVETGIFDAECSQIGRRNQKSHVAVAESPAFSAVHPQDADRLGMGDERYAGDGDDAFARRLFGILEAGVVAHVLHLRRASVENLLVDRAALDLNGPLVEIVLAEAIHRPHLQTRAGGIEETHRRGTSANCSCRFFGEIGKNGIQIETAADAQHDLVQRIEVLPRRDLGLHFIPLYRVENQGSEIGRA